MIYLIKKYNLPPNWHLFSKTSIDYNSTGDTLKIDRTATYLITFEYNEQGLISKKRYFSDWTFWYEYHWEYNSDNLLWRYYYYSKSPLYPEIYGGIKYEYKYNEYSDIDYRKEYDLDNGNPYYKTIYFYSEFFVDIDEKKYLESNNFPNPFYSKTTFQYELNESGFVNLAIYNSLGKQVDIISQNQTSGKQELVWNAENFPSGMYYFRLQAGEQFASRKMVLMK